MAKMIKIGNAKEIELYRGLVNHFSRSELARYLAIILYQYGRENIKPHYSIDIVNYEVMEKLESIKAFKEVLDVNQINTRG